VILKKDLSVSRRSAVRGRNDPLLVAIDVGTTGARAAAIDLHGSVVSEVRRPYETRIPYPGWAEQDPRDWAERAVEALAGLARRVRRTERILGIGLTGQCPTVAPFDLRGRAVGPGMLYRDNRAVAEAEEMRRAIGVEAMHRKTGHVADAFHVGPKVLWLRKHQPDVFLRAARFLQPRDVVLRRLTGLEVTDETHADATLFFDLRARRWAPELFSAFDLDPDLFPQAFPSWTATGILRKRVAEEVGLRAGLPVVLGAADSQCVAYGAGVVEPGPVSEMAGSSSCLNSAVLAPVADVRVTHYSHAVPDRFTTELGVNTTGAAFDWAVRALGYPDHGALGGDAERFRRRWQRSARNGGSNRERDAAPIFLPYLGDGERDDPRLRGAFVGLSDRHDRTALAYAVLEGVALGVRATLTILQEAGCPLEELRVAGGGARLPLVGQLKADMLDRPVLHLDGDAAAIGAAMLAGTAGGVTEEALVAIDRVIRRGRRFDPSDWGREIAAVRAEWFDSVRASQAVRAAEQR